MNAESVRVFNTNAIKSIKTVFISNNLKELDRVKKQ